MSAVRRRASAGLAGMLTTLLIASPALAADPLGPAEGADPGPSLNTGVALLLFIGIPLASFALLAAFTLLPGAMRSHRYRPAQGWTASPVWFAGPLDPDAAIAGAQTGDVTRGGASGSW